jgi:hypothetical protein
MLEVVLRELERIFLEDSGLAEARQGMRVTVSRPAHYLELLERIQVHGYHPMQGQGRVLENADIAADWYDAIYMPTLTAIERTAAGAGGCGCPAAEVARRPSDSARSSGALRGLRLTASVDRERGVALRRRRALRATTPCA